MTRTVAREIAIQLGFAVAAAGQEPESAVEAFFEPEHYASMAGESELYAQTPSDAAKDFIKQSVVGVAQKAFGARRLYRQIRPGLAHGTHFPQRRRRYAPGHV